MNKNYELLIKDKDGVWQTADMGNDTPVMNYQVNDLAQLQNRNANWSHTIKLPFTNTNCRIFELLNLFDAKSDLPYSMHDCRLYRDGFDLAGKGSKIILKSVSQFFECQIISGIADFFTTLKDKTFEDEKIDAELPGHQIGRAHV